MSVADAIATLEKAATSASQHALVKGLKAEFMENEEAGPGANANKGKPPVTPGQKAARSAAPPAFLGK